MIFFNRWIKVIIPWSRLWFPSDGLDPTVEVLTTSDGEVSGTVKSEFSVVVDVVMIVVVSQRGRHGSV